MKPLGSHLDEEERYITEGITFRLYLEFEQESVQNKL